MFPAIKDMVRYGADTLSNSDFLDDMVDAFVDAAAGTLGYAAPAFLPAILAAAGEVKDPLHNAATDALKAASQWAQRDNRNDDPKWKHITGNAVSRPYAPVMIDAQPAYGSDVID